jgi:hypothetical protein
MKKLFVVFLALIAGSPLLKADKIEKEKKRIFAEVLALYTLILSNWTSNDLYYENEFNTGIVKGYLSYRDKDTLKTIFWREVDTTSAAYKASHFKQAGDTVTTQALKTITKEEELRKIVKTISYTGMRVSKDNAKIAEEEREPTLTEKNLMDYRAVVYKMIDSDTTFFKKYNGTTLRVVPFDAGDQVKVYIYSSVKQSGMVPIGGDYEIIFDKKEKKVIQKTDLHKECIFISGKYNGKASDLSKNTQHTHQEGAAPLITPTDIASLLLYKSQLQWDEHFVVAGKYTCVFTLVDKTLNIMPTEEFKQLKNKKMKMDEEEKGMH